MMKSPKAVLPNHPRIKKIIHDVGLQVEDEFFDLAVEVIRQCAATAKLAQEQSTSVPQNISECILQSFNLSPNC